MILFLNASINFQHDNLIEKKNHFSVPYTCNQNNIDIFSSRHITRKWFFEVMLFNQFPMNCVLLAFSSFSPTEVIGQKQLDYIF